MAAVTKRAVLKTNSLRSVSLKEKIIESNNGIMDKKRATLNQSYMPLLFLFAVRLCSVAWNNISDCDETYNYWEPTHYFLYGYGFQTWEYSPVYAIRSYAYIWIHALVGSLFYFLDFSKVQVFYMIRCFLGLFCALSEYYFYRGISNRFGCTIANIVLLFLLFGAGMFISSTAYLPSSFSMYMTMISYGALFSQHYKISILSTAASTLIGWPFAAILGLPIAYNILIRMQRIKFFITMCLISLITIMGPIILIDSFYYDHFIISPLNIVLYNVFGEQGSQLYGVEPWTFYFINGFLNFNILFFLALFSGPLILYRQMKVGPAEKKIFSKFWNPISGMYFWIVIFFTQAHKEERFLFPIYPLMCLNGAVALQFIQKALISIIPNKISHQKTKKLISIVVVTYTIFSISRVISLYKGYSAPIQVFKQLHSNSENIFTQGKLNTFCAGKEWYRFPTNFFLPVNFRMHFIKSDFHGQLPKPFSNFPNATRAIPDGMNDQNLEEGNQYKDVKKCQYLLDSDFPTESLLEPRYSQQFSTWKTVLSVPFLDAKRSPRLLRAFYIPILSEKYCTFVRYNILKRLF